MHLLVQRRDTWRLSYRGIPRINLVSNVEWLWNGMRFSIVVGDYLVVQPTNPRPLVDRILRRFALQTDDLIQVHGTKKAFLVCSLEDFQALCP